MDGFDFGAFFFLVRDSIVEFGVGIGLGVGIETGSCVCTLACIAWQRCVGYLDVAFAFPQWEAGVCYVPGSDEEVGWWRWVFWSCACVRAWDVEFEFERLHF